jgi:hypothetical protein
MDDELARLFPGAAPKVLRNANYAAPALPNVTLIRKVPQ